MRGCNRFSNQFLWLLSLKIFSRRRALFKLFSLISISLPNRSCIFDRAAVRAALRYKYKPLIRDGNAVEVEGVTQRITFVLEGEGKGPGYVPENCRGIEG